MALLGLVWPYRRKRATGSGIWCFQMPKPGPVSLPTTFQPLGRSLLLKTRELELVRALTFKIQMWESRFLLRYHVSRPTTILSTMMIMD